MNTVKIILTTIMAVIYVAILKYFEGDFGLERKTSLMILIILIYITGFFITRMNFNKSKQ